jgi:rubrerythrin
MTVLMYRVRDAASDRDHWECVECGDSGTSHRMNDFPDECPSCGGEVDDIADMPAHFRTRH